MKTGKPTRLSEKLNAELDTIRQGYAASMASQLESFRTELTDIASDARRTIETDIRFFLNDSKSELQRRSETIRRWLTISPWVIVGLITVWIASMMAASFFWTVHLTRSELTEMGLTRIERPEGTWLILDPSKTRLRTCTMGGQSITCIRIEEN